MSLWSRAPFVAVRVLGRDGQYPHFDILTRTHLYVATERLVWTAVVQPGLPADWEIGECTPLVPEEVRLLAAISLCEANPWDHGMPIVTHGGIKHLDGEEIDFDLRDSQTRSRVEGAVAEIGPGPARYERPGNRDATFCVRDDLGTYDDAMELLANIDARDQLILAGLARLLGANRLLRFANEPEEAAIAMFISTGAALEYIRHYLAGDQDPNSVPFTRVSDYLRTTFPEGDAIAEYFELRYEERIIAVHPSSRFGEFWAPPLMMSDIYHLRKSLIGLYRHILLGEVPDYTDEDVAR